MIKVCVSGCKGRMGSRILELAKKDAGLEVAGAFDIGVDPEPFINRCDCLIEFTTPKVTIEHLDYVLRLKKAYIVGTTGLAQPDIDKLKKASEKVPIVFSPNMSIGVNLLFRIAEIASKVLGKEYEVKIREAHHVHKKDAPSGTAKNLASIVMNARGGPEAPPIDSKREGEIIGDHTLTFESPVDTVELTHSAKTRDIFVMGALKAARFVVGKTPKLYTMREVLGI